MQQPWTLDTSKPPDTPGPQGETNLTFSAPPDFENPADQNRDNEYQARIYGTHQDGGCTGSAVDVVVRVRDIAAPPQEVREPIAQFRQVHPLNILVEWNPPPTTDSNGQEFSLPVENYQAEYRPRDDDPWLVAQVTGTQAVITPASQNQYQIRVRGSSQDRNGPWTSFSATNHLSPDRPEQLTVSSAGETSLTVTWNEPSGKGRWIDGYRIEYRRSGTGEWTNWPHQGNGTTATITGLQLRTRTLPTSNRAPSARLYTSKSQPPQQLQQSQGYPARSVPPLHHVNSPMAGNSSATWPNTRSARRNTTVHSLWNRPAARRTIRD